MFFYFEYLISFNCESRPKSCFEVLIKIDDEPSERVPVFWKNSITLLKILLKMPSIPISNCRASI